MSDTAINALRGPLKIGSTPDGRGPASGSESSGFGELLDKKLTELEGLQHDADHQVKNFALGNGDGLQEAVVAIEKASLSFEMMMKVRGKILDAYQDVMRMQV